MLKLLEKIEAEALHRVPGPSMALASVSLDVAAPRPGFIEDTWAWNLGVNLGMYSRGPKYAREELLKRARRAIAHEVYGEVEDIVRLALRDIWEEGLFDTKAAKRLEGLLLKLRGE